MSTITNKLTVSPSPHIKDKVTTSSLMRDVIIALLPAAVASVVIFGMRSLILIATCVITCVVGEYLFNMACKKPQTIGDLSAVVTGIRWLSTCPPPSRSGWLWLVLCLPS